MNERIYTCLRSLVLHNFQQKWFMLIFALRPSVKVCWNWRVSKLQFNHQWNDQLYKNSNPITQLTTDTLFIILLYLSGRVIAIVLSIAMFRLVRGTSTLISMNMNPFTSHSHWYCIWGILYDTLRERIQRQWVMIFWRLTLFWKILKCSIWKKAVKHAFTRI